MFKNRSKDNKNNICGKQVYKLRLQQEQKMSQNKLAIALQLQGLDIDKNAIQRIESGQRFVTDIELAALCKVFKVKPEELLKED